MSVDVDGHDIEVMNDEKLAELRIYVAQEITNIANEIESLEDERSMLETKTDDWYMDQEAIDAETAKRAAIAKTRELLA